jgi:hypothetical protein
MRFQLSIIILACTLGAVTNISSGLNAADIIWDPAIHAVSPAADFVLGGTLDRAYSFGPSGSLSINGITFTPFDTNSHSDKTSLEGRYDAYSSGGQAGDYGSLLSHGAFHDVDARNISFSGLVPGAAYTVEVVASGLRARTDCCEAGAGYTNLFVYNKSSSTPAVSVHWDANDSISQDIYGRFIADSSGQQTIDFNLDQTVTPGQTTSAQIHGIVLSYTAVPEPTTLLLLALGSIGVALTLRRRGRTS